MLHYFVYIFLVFRVGSTIWKAAVSQQPVGSEDDEMFIVGTLQMGQRELGPGS